MIYADSVSSLSLASELSGGISLFSRAHGMAGEGHARPGQPAQAARPNIRVYTEHAQFVDVS